MALTFTNDRFFKTDVGHKIFQNVPRASQWWKMRVTSRSVISTTNGQEGFLSKEIFNIWHQFIGLGDSTSIPVRFVVTNAAGSFAQIDLRLTIGVTYGIAVTWDGVAGEQKVWLSGIPTRFGTFTGNTQDNSSALQIGVKDPAIRIVYVLDDHNVWDNYTLTAADIANLLNGADATTIGTSATWRGRWTLAGPVGTAAKIGDAGLKNAYGGGARLSAGGDGSDCISAGGAGSAIYAPTLVWEPTVAADPVYLDTSGKAAVVFFKSLVNGSQVTPSQILTIPSISKNGAAPVALKAPWFTGYHPFGWFPLPTGMTLAPGDTATLSAPVAWCNTPAGAVEALDNLPLVNRVGKSVIRPDDYTPTLPIGANNPQTPMALWGFYNPLKNWKYRTYGGKGKYTGPGPWPVYQNTGVNGIDATNYPGPKGLWCVMWDANNPAAPTSFAITTNAPTTTKITERLDLKATPASGIGMCRVFDVQHMAPTGSADLTVNLTLSGPIDYANLWIVGPGDVDIVGGAVVLDRSDPWALSKIYRDRVPQNVGSLRWEDSTIAGDPHSFPYPEQLRSLTDESWSDIAFARKLIGYNAVGPINTTATPFIYSQFLGKPGALGQTFTATLASAITTTPPPGTRETYTFPDAATAPLMAGLEIKLDAEIMRIVSITGTSVVLNRGSNNTTPAPHAAGPVTVYGRKPITTVLSAAGALANGLVWQLTTAIPHGVLTGTGITTNGTTSYPLLTFSNGDKLQLFGMGRAIYATGPNTFFQAIGGSGGGGTLAAPVALDPAKQYWEQRWPWASTMPHEACAIITGKFPNANLHVNIWPDACDDLVYEIARRVLANFPAGRKIYVEYTNEPWNWSFGTFYFHTAVMGPLLLPSKPYNLAHYAWRAYQVHDIFRTVFATAGRAGEIVAMLNCQMGSSDAQSHMNYAITLGKPVDAIAIAPYVQTEDTSYNNTFINGLDDEQVISLFIHDLWYNPRTYNAYAATDKKYIADYNAATGRNCIMMGYEGGIEFVLPNNTKVLNRETRNHDCITDPAWYFAEGDFYAWLQYQGFDHLHVYALAMFWGPQAWGIYHGITQEAGYGDGSDGKFNNLLCRANPTSPHYKGSTVNQDLNTVSVRGQAFIDWLGAIDHIPPPPATEYSVTPPVPASGLVGTPSGPFLVALDGPYTGTVTAHLDGGGLNTTIVLTWANSSAGQSFTITPTAAGTVALTFTNSGTLTDPPSLTYEATAPPPVATEYTVTAPVPASGPINQASGPFLVAVDAPYTGTVTAHVDGGGLSTTIVLTWANSSAGQSFAITPTAEGTVALTFTNSGDLPDADSLTYQAAPPTSDDGVVTIGLSFKIPCLVTLGFGSAGGVTPPDETIDSFLWAHLSVAIDTDAFLAPHDSVKREGGS
jgi:hypothetical protein